MSEMSFLFHVHTRASHDSLLDIKTIIDFCVKSRVQLLAITDHDSFENTNDYETLCRDSGIRLIKGVEYTSDAGDIIGLFIDTFHPHHDCNAILRDIREQGGISVIPHPYIGHKLDLIDFDLVDCLEIFNPRCDDISNSKARALAKRLDKAELVAGDVHLRSELELARNVFIGNKERDQTDEALKQIILGCERLFHTARTDRKNIYISQAIKGIRTRNLSLLTRNVVKIILEPFRRRRS